MAHHQGMSLVAACNLLTEGAIQDLFHAEPAVAATELLLHEKLRATVRVEPVSNPSGDKSSEGRWAAIQGNNGATEATLEHSRSSLALNEKV
jgi:hypothetical protein